MSRRSSVFRTGWPSLQAPQRLLFNGRGQRLDRYSAATANGSAADWCELDEGYRRVVCHAGLYSVPALLAEAEATGASGKDLLRALVIGYEISARIARTFTWSTLTLHPHGSLAAVGAAASVATLRGLRMTLAAAVSSAATMVHPASITRWRARWCGMSGRGSARGRASVRWTGLSSGSQGGQKACTTSTPRRSGATFIPKN